MGTRARALTIVTFAVVLLGALVGPAQSTHMPLQYGFRYAVASSGAIVVGAVVSTDAPQPRSGLRFSRIVVQRTLYGSVEPGDTLRVRWHAQSWDVGGGVEGFLSSEVPQLSEMTGVRVLWLVRTGEYTSVSSDSVVLEPSNAGEIAQLVRFIGQPQADDRLAGALNSEGAAESTSLLMVGMSEKLAAVAAYLGGYLDGLARGAEGRSN